MRGGRWFLAYAVSHKLHRRIFFLLGASIIMTGLVSSLVFRFTHDPGHHPWQHALLFVFFIMMLWGASGRIARRLTRPYVELARVAQEIGAGNLATRFSLRRYGRSGEAFLIGVAVNEMAERIEKQIKDQRELLAAVSHEVRTPLARIRMLAELARTETHGGKFLVDGKMLDDVDREVVEIDALVGELLASSRLDFAALTTSELDAAEVARLAVERQSLTPRLELPGEKATFTADPTLIQRALANLLHTAVIHAGGVDALVVTSTRDKVCFEVKDRGPGLPAGEEGKVFASFYRPDGAARATESSLGLGLALVRRIAVAHGGRAFAKARDDGPGASVGIELPRARAANARPS